MECLFAFVKFQARAVYVKLSNCHLKVFTSCYVFKLFAYLCSNLMVQLIFQLQLESKHEAASTYVDVVGCYKRDLLSRFLFFHLINTYLSFVTHVILVLSLDELSGIRNSSHIIKSLQDILTN